MTIKSRLRRVEVEARGGLCDSCRLPPDGPGRIVIVDDGLPSEGFPDDPAELCGGCGRPLWCVIEVVYEDAGGVER